MEELLQEGYLALHKTENSFSAYTMKGLESDMIVIVCMDNRKGMMFHHRRQSQDRILRKHILEMTGSNRLWMNEYSYRQFSDTDPERIHMDPDFLAKAGTGEYCFVEDSDLSPYTEEIEKVILFHWNRDYPADTYFTLDISGWTLEASEEIAGYSHEKITKEIYAR